MSAATDLTENGRKSRVTGAQRDLRRSREKRVTFWRAVVASSFFLLVLSASLFLGAVMMVGTLGGQDSSNLLTADGRTARFARTLSDGIRCHYMIFDNKTAQTVEDRIGSCDEGKPKSKPERPAAFSWGNNR
jgi:hypothetical protein